MINPNENIFKLEKRTITIDRLKLCFDCPFDLYDRVKGDLVLTDDGLFFNYEDRDVDGIRISISTFDDDFELYRIGTLTVSGSDKYKNMAFLAFTNESIYHVFGYDEAGKPYNAFKFIDMIKTHFSLRFRCVTKIELAVDTNINIINRIRKYIRNYGDYDCVINGRKVKSENEIIEKYGEYYERTRKGITKKPTLYFHQKDNSYFLKVYDKTREIEKSGKKYITEDKHVFRAELTIKNEDIREFCKSLAKIPELSKYGDYSSIEDYINNDEFLFLLFWKYTKRMVYFVDKKTRVRTYITDILKVTERYRPSLSLIQR